MSDEKENIKTIELASIVIDPKQPRKTFNVDSLVELGNSIKELGLMQPIIVRPVVNNKYMIIAGERRYRASLLASLSTIICLVKEDLNEDTILEMQIVENLQREEIDPIEESESFFTLQNLGYKVEDIALKIGKSVPFVYQRFALSQLNDGFKKMVSDGILKLSYALKISALESVKQDSLFETLNGEWTKWKFEEFINAESIDLKDANFSLKENNIKNGINACSDCVFNTLNKGDLFSNGKQYCTNIICFTDKKNISFEKILEDAIITNTMLIVNQYGINGGHNKEFNDHISFLNKKGFKAYGYSEGHCLSKPIDILTIEEYQEENNCSDENLKEWYDEYVLEHEEEKKEWVEAQNSDKYLKAKKYSLYSLNLIDDEEVLFKLSEKSETNHVVNVSQKNMEECTNEEKIIKIKDKELRKKEIEATKLLKELYQLTSFTSNKDDLSDLERLTFIHAVINSSNYNEEKKLSDLLGKDIDNSTKLLKTFDKGLYNMFVRTFIKSQVSTHENSSIAYNNVNKGFYQIIKKSDMKNVKVIEKRFKEDENKRILRVTERIEALK